MHRVKLLLGLLFTLLAVACAQKVKSINYIQDVDVTAMRAATTSRFVKQ